MLKIEKHQYAINIECRASFEYTVLTPQIAVYRLQQGPVNSEAITHPFVASVPERVSEQFTLPSAALAFAEGRSNDLPAIPLLVLLPPNFQQDMQELGFNNATQKAESLGFNGAGSQTPYTDIVDNNADLSRLGLLDRGAHMLFDLNHECLPAAVFCDYISGDFENGKYDLNRAVAILRQDPRVLFVTSAMLRAQIAPPGQEITSIPHYNQSEGRTRGISCRFCPTAEDAKKMWKCQQSFGSKYPSTFFFQALESLDILGLVAGGALLPERDDS